MVAWPVIIKYIGEDELTYIESQQEWLNDPDLHFHPYTKGDEIIDSNGSVYNLPYNEKEKMVEIVKINKTMAVSEFESWIKNHMVSLNQCCSAKIKITSFKEGILIVGKTNE